MSESFKHQSREIKSPATEAEKFFEFKEWGLSGEWLKISTLEGKTVEGAHYKAKNSNGEVIIFHPGLPGDAVGQFEENHVDQLLKEGYDVFVARHNGLKNQENCEKLFHNRNRVDQNKKISGEPLGWFDEPEASISYFAQQDKPITLITHSFSGILAANSFIEMSKRGTDLNPAKKVKKWIMPSASIWDLRENGVLDPDRNFTMENMKKYCEYLTKVYSIPSEENLSQLLKKIKETLNLIDTQISSSIPESIEVIGVYPEHDKLVSPEIGINFINKLPRGIILRDNYMPTDKNEDAHDFKHAQASDLVRVIKMKTSKSKHVFDINK